MTEDERLDEVERILRHADYELAQGLNARIDVESVLAQVKRRAEARGTKRGAQPKLGTDAALSTERTEPLPPPEDLMGLLEQVHKEPDVIPPPLRWVLGPDAVPQDQARIAAFLLEQAMTNSAPALLDVGIRMLEEAVDRLSAGLDRQSHITMLGAAYRIRYERYGLAEELYRAVALAEQSLVPVATEPVDRAWRLSNAAETQFVLFGHMADKQATVVANIGASYQQRFTVRGDDADLRRAIGYCERALGSSGNSSIIATSQ